MARYVGLTIKEPAKFVCHVCGKEYKSEDALAKHMKDKHPETGSNEGKDPE